jgi:hypothetical protein
MLRLLKNFLCAGLLVAGVPSSFGFSLLGPFDTWQVATLTYRVGGDLGGPMNLGEEYRRNTPVLYYSFDANFLDYFGAKGVAAAEKAIAIFNAVTNVSSYSKDLAEFPLEAYGENYTAEALSLVDLKSVTMNLLLEQMGLGESDRWTWCLHDRLVGPPPGCPINVEYTVIKRNFDPVTTEPSTYVNGTLYSYIIEEFCTGTPFLADAAEVNVDPLANNFTAVSSIGFNLDTLAGFPVASFGHYFTGLTRDDVGGLRYLLKTNNMNTETAGPGTLVYTTNRTAQLLYTSNLNFLASVGLTNDAATLQALFPGLVVADSSVYFQNIWVPTVTTYLTNYPFDPVGTPPYTVSVTNWTLTVGTFYHHTYANVYTVTQPPNALGVVPITDPRAYNQTHYITVTTTQIKAAPWAPAGSGILVTNTTTMIVATNSPVGEYFFLPAGACDVAILYPQLTNYITTTNIISITTNYNTTSVTNTGVTNSAISTTTTSYVDYATTHAYAIKAIICESNSIALRQGIEHVQFVRRDFDSLLGQFYNPITNYYTLKVITNNVIVKQRVRRLVNNPDLLFTAQDLATTTADNVIGAGLVARNLAFNAANAYPGLAGPGTINPNIVFTYDKVGPIYLNPFFLNTTNATYGEDTGTLIFIWGSFDGTTNYPTIYPEGTSINDLADQVLLYATTASLPAGSVGVPYAQVGGLPVQFTVSGGTAPYTWEIVSSPDYPGLPPGLSLNRNTAIVSGTPTLPGEFPFILRITDAGARSSDWNYAIIINP